MRILSVLALAFAHAALAQENSLKFTSLAPGAESAFVVGTAGTLPLPFTAPQGVAFEVDVPPMLADSGNAISPEPSIAEIPGARAIGGHLAFITQSTPHTPPLKVPRGPPPRRYTGA